MRVSGLAVFLIALPFPPAVRWFQPALVRASSPIARLALVLASSACQAAIW